MTIQTTKITNHLGTSHYAAWLYDGDRCVAYAIAYTDAEAREKVVDPRRSIR
jgi:hypothetical protein